MATNKEYIDGQEEAGKQIKAIYDKYKRDGATHQTAQYVESRTANLEALWKDFQQRHKLIQPSVFWTELSQTSRRHLPHDGAYA